MHRISSCHSLHIITNAVSAAAQRSHSLRSFYYWILPLPPVVTGTVLTATGLSVCEQDNSLKRYSQIFMKFVELVDYGPEKS